jgi:hypothetical protein
MAKKPAKTAHNKQVKENWVPSFWVFSTFEGKGKAKMPVKGFHDRYDAQMLADDINGYVVDMYVKAIMK